jgi:CO/xanthine dehydrogenase Mo-binding subunit
VTIEREYRTSMFHQGYIEPQNGTAMWARNGELTVWTSTQGAFTVRDQLAAVFKVPVSQVKVIPMEIGGGFGGKIPIYLDPVAALLSKKTGRPVKITMNRTEVFEATGPTSGTSIRIKAAERVASSPRQLRIWPTKPAPTRARPSAQAQCACCRLTRSTTSSSMATTSS